MDEIAAEFDRLLARYQRDTADAIILERAARVLRRRHDFRALEGIPERLRFSVYAMEDEARKLRKGAEDGV